MSTIKIINEKPITMAEVREELAKIQKKNKELNFRANKTYTYLQEFSKLSSNKTKELISKVESLKIPRLKEDHIVKIADTLPKYPEEVKALLSGFTITLTNENAKKIAEAVKSFC
ncbi:MAG: RNA polymerase Rpb4 [Candidatus Woesearchaeota archaeon]